MCLLWILDGIEMSPEPYYCEDGITIFHGDCREILPSLGRFDLLLTDPPYGVAVKTSNASSQRGFRPYSPNGRAVDMPPVHGDNAPFEPGFLMPLARFHILWGANNYACRLPGSPFWLVWDRKYGGGADSDITDCELAAVFGHRFKTVRMFRHLWAGFQRGSEAGEKVLHPTQKPVALFSWCLSFFPEARTVIDPYMGSGPVARACKDAGRNYVGIEISEEYCEIAVNRLRQGVLIPC